MSDSMTHPDPTRAAAPLALPLVTPTSFRSLMATFPAGVAVVTTTEPDGQLRGMTCSAVSSVSDRPPTLLVCLQESSRTLAALSKTATFAVNLLHCRARFAAELFASNTDDRFSRVRWTRQPFFGGPHLTEHAHMIADCRVTRSIIVADHAVVFGEVFEVTRPTGRPPGPLLYGLRSYWALDEGDSTTLDAATERRPSNEGI